MEVVGGFGVIAVLCCGTKWRPRDCSRRRNVRPRKGSRLTIDLEIRWNVFGCRCRSLHTTTLCGRSYGRAVTRYPEAQIDQKNGDQNAAEPGGFHVPNNTISQADTGP